MTDVSDATEVELYSEAARTRLDSSRGACPGRLRSNTHLSVDEGGVVLKWLGLVGAVEGNGVNRRWSRTHLCVL